VLSHALNTFPRFAKKGCKEQPIKSCSDWKWPKQTLQLWGMFPRWQHGWIGCSVINTCWCSVAHCHNKWHKNKLVLKCLELSALVMCCIQENTWLHNGHYLLQPNTSRCFGCSASIVTRVWTILNSGCHCFQHPTWHMPRLALL